MELLQECTITLHYPPKYNSTKYFDTIIKNTISSDIYSKLLLENTYQPQKQSK